MKVDPAYHPRIEAKRGHPARLIAHALQGLIRTPDATKIAIIRRATAVLAKANQ